MLIVTGVPRSGTTPLGYILSNVFEYNLIHEPFNYRSGLNEVGSYFEHKLIDDDIDWKLLSRLARIEAGTNNYKSGIFDNDSFIHKIGKIILGSRTVRSVRKFNSCTNDRKKGIKDPFLCFSIETLVKYTDELIVTIRSPSGICRSFVKNDWRFPEVLECCDEVILDLMNKRPVKDYLFDSEFNALVCQYNHYKQLIDCDEIPFIIDMAKLPVEPEKWILGLQRKLDKEGVDAIRFVNDMYKEKRSKNSNVHNHKQSQNSLLAKNNNWKVKDENIKLFEVVKEMYESISSKAESKL